MARAGVLRQLLREPLVHFLVVGLALFLAAEHHRRAGDPRRIEITPERISALKGAYAAEFGTAPSEEMTGRLIEEFVEAEVLYREGLARRLAEGDEIVRRRIIQKASFLIKDVEPLPAPSEQQLRAWFEAHGERYAASAEVDFSHIFFAAEPRQEEAARARARQVLSTLDVATLRAPERGDSFPDLYDFSGFGPDEARRLFGDSDVARILFTAPVGHWSGPFRSSFGWHLVRVGKAQSARARPFETVREAVLADYMAEARERANAERLAGLKTRYTVVCKD